MKCSFCKNKAVINTENKFFCKDHFRRRFLKKVEETIKKYKLFSKNDKILVAVSGGKDSLALAHVLNELGYDFSGLFIDLCIGVYSEHCKKVVENFFREIDKELFVERVENYGVKIKKVKRRSACSICGIVKRYLMNKFAYENGFTVLATAHNLDDVASFILSNMFSGNIDLILKQKPRLDSEGKFVKKVKPLFFITEKESLVYCLINNINFYDKECPLSFGASQQKWKKKLIEVEKVVPNFKRVLVSTFLKLPLQKEKENLKNCIECGYPCSGYICSFCKLKKLFMES